MKQKKLRNACARAESVLFLMKTALPEGEATFLDYANYDCLIVLGGGTGTLRERPQKRANTTSLCWALNLGPSGILTEN
jgi:hypothetical protein